MAALHELQVIRGSLDSGRIHLKRHVWFSLLLFMRLLVFMCCCKRVMLVHPLPAGIACVQCTGFSTSLLSYNGHHWSL
jgi:hypothetical protein